MNTSAKSAGILENVRIKLSALWVAMMLLYIYADILSLFKPGQLDKIIDGFMGPFPVTQASLVVASILMIIPAVMVFLSVTLRPNVNRWLNIGLGFMYILVNISNLIGETWAYYITFGIIEIVLAFLIVWYAWKWPAPENKS